MQMDFLDTLLPRLESVLPFAFVAFFALMVLMAYRANRSAQPGVRPLRGMKVWSESLPEPIAARLVLVSAPLRTEAAGPFGTTVATEILPDGDDLFIKVVGGSRGMRNPYVATVDRRERPLRISYRMDPLLLVEFAIVALVAVRAMGASWITGLFCLWLLIILGINGFKVRRVVLPQLRKWAGGETK